MFDNETTNNNIIASISIINLSWTLPRLIDANQPDFIPAPIQISLGILFNIIIWSMVINRIKKLV